MRRARASFLSLIAGLGVASISLNEIPAAEPEGPRDAVLQVDAARVVGRVGPYLAGACIEDVNHEIYGGLYSQMIFGESFQEPAPVAPVRGFRAYGGRWTLEDGVLMGEGNDGPRLIRDGEAFAAGTVGVEAFFPDRAEGNAGLVLNVSRPGLGADAFEGYEISLDPRRQVLVFGRHRHNWEPIREVACEVPVGRWIPLVVNRTGTAIEVRVADRVVLRHDDREHPLGPGAVGLRPWRRSARFRKLWVQTDRTTETIPFEPSKSTGIEVSGMWRPIRQGAALGKFGLETDRPFTGRQSQRIQFVSGSGAVGVENQGLNRWGLAFVAGKPYEGYLWARAEEPADLVVALESRDGSTSHAEARVAVAGRDWRRYDFSLTPRQANSAGRLAVVLRRPGSVVLGHAFLQPGPWGRFRDLPVRRDVTEALIDQGIRVLRYGGSMVNDDQYRWKTMIGPRDRRPPYRGTWYPDSTNGWGIVDFLNVCEAAGFLGIPAFYLGETPRDMADFVEYVNGPADSEWGRRRVADGHPAPYRLRYLELGNEERVDEEYARKFQALAEAIWAKDPEIILVVGDFVYDAPIHDPDHVRRAASRITSLAGHRKVLELAKAHDREVWFDVHVNTDGPGATASLRALPSYVEALDRVAAGARHKVVVFEFNAHNHQHRRALGNALAILAIERIAERVPIATSANCLQPDGQNDNGWDQGLLFLNPSKVWLQPPGYVTWMISRSHQPLRVEARLEPSGETLDATALRSEDGRTLVLQAVNLAAQPVPITLRIEGFRPSKPVATVEELAGPLDAVNTAVDPERIRPKRSEWRHGLGEGPARIRLGPHSFTVLVLE